jgi:TonB-dependent SusC/RagA subfamily outer membrane receptor
MQSIQLSIPTPCHQNWDKMTPTEQGRFCNACAKQVVDFTTMSDGEVLNYFINKKDENVCGRTLPNQLDRVLEAPKAIVPSKLWYWKYAAAAGLLLMGKEGVGQTMEQLLNKSQFNSFETYSTTVKSYPFFKGDNAIRGCITDEEGKGIPFAKLEVIGKKNKITADANGFYFIRVDINSDEITVSAYGYTSKKVVVKNLNSFDIKLAAIENNNSGFMLGAMVGGISISSLAPIDLYNVATIKVKETNGDRLNDVIFIVKKNYSSNFDTLISIDGIHRIKNIKGDESFLIKASKEGYQSKEIIIDHSSFTKRKGVFEIKLEKIIEKPIDVNVKGEVSVRMGGVRNIQENNQPLIVLDGSIIANNLLSKISPNEIEGVSILKDAQATALYGSAGANGVMLITTKKQIKKDTLPTPNYKLMDEVVVASYGIKKCRTVTGDVTTISMGAIVQGKSISVPQIDTLKQKIQNLFSPIKTFPNPVKKGELLHLSFPNKNKFYTLQIINSVGVVMLQNKYHDGSIPSNAYTKTITQQIPIATNWSSGYYFINIVNEQGKVIAKSSFLVL